jgi:hypothetical protein
MMNKFNTFVVLFILLGVVRFQAVAQSNFPSAHGYWEGNWGGSTPFNVYLEPGKDGAMTGTITWSLQYYDDAAGKLADTFPKEFLRGIWNEKTGMLILNTTGEEDPYGLLAPGYYQMQMDASGAVLKGFTSSASNGYFQTEIEMSRIRT